MTNLKDILHDVQVLSLEAQQENGEAEVTGVGLQDYKDRLQEIIDEAHHRILTDLLGVENEDLP